jgi:hypothetical protein
LTPGWSAGSRGGGGSASWSPDESEVMHPL